ncbi:MAG: RNA-binding cell elongation regulator Jag/EloR [Desulfuromonadales bacterium]
MLDIEIVAYSIENAVQMALDRFGCTRAEIDVDIIEAPSPGFFGLFRKKAKVRVRLTDRSHVAAFVCQNLLDKSGLTAAANLSVCRDQSEIDISGPDMPKVIGRKGQTLDALQYLAVAITDRFTADRTPVVLDCDNYRQKRKTFIRRLADRLGTQAKKSGKPVTVPPLPPRERRIMHVTLQKFEALDIRSQGQGFERKMVISPRRG